MAGIKIKNVTKVYNKEVLAVNNLSLNIEDNEFIVFVGPSGCGKSTLLRMIAGLEDITEGEIYIGDRLINKVEAKDRNVSMVFQNYALFPHLSAYKNISFGLEVRKDDNREVIEEKVLRAAEKLGIVHLLERKPGELSGGERQRVALGRAIVRNPDVFLFDEPLSNLDAKLKTSMRGEIIRLHKELQTTFIYVTHDQIEALTMADKIVVMKDGIIQQADTPENIFKNPENIFVASFIGSPAMNFIRGKLVEENNKIYFTLWNNKIDITDIFLNTHSLKRYLEKDIVLGIRPEYVSIIKSESSIEVKVDLIESLGSENYIYTFIDGKEFIIKVGENFNFKEKDSIDISLNLDKILLFDCDTEKNILCY